MNKEEIAKSINEGLKILKQEPSFIFYPEEIKAIEKLKHHIEFAKEFPSECFDTENKIVLNLISRLQKELDIQKQGNKDLVKEGVKLSAKIVELQKELDKKNKLIEQKNRLIKSQKQYIKDLEESRGRK